MISKIINKLKVVLFRLRYSSKFKRLGNRSYIAKILRLDGAQYIEIGERVSIQKYSWLLAVKNGETDPELVIGDGSTIGNFNHITAVRSVIFGKNILTADKVYVSDNLHEFEDISIPIMNQGIKFKDNVVIGDGTWIGENVSIIGAKIGKNCVIGSNSVVTNNIPDYSVAVGSPAKVIKQYDMGTMNWKKIT
jgi:acetyltransferase-like isoleucine patch superfamily enzyme